MNLDHWHRLLYLGESGLAIPLAVMITLCLLMAGQGARALLWMVSFGLGGAALLAAKAAFSFAGWSAPELGVYSVSGHAMLTAAIYPLLFTLLGSTISPRAARIGPWLGFLLLVPLTAVLVIGFYHTLTEALVGAAIGSAVSWVNLRHWRPLRAEHVCATVVLLLAGMVVLDPRGVVGGVQDAWRDRMVRWTGVTFEYFRSIDPDPATGKNVVTVLQVPEEEQDMQHHHAPSPPVVPEPPAQGPAG